MASNRVIAALSAYNAFALYQYVIVSLVFHISDF